jgi:hypothetical protein
LGCLGSPFSSNFNEVEGKQVFIRLGISDVIGDSEYYEPTTVNLASRSTPEYTTPHTGVLESVLKSQVKVLEYSVVYNRKPAKDV